jgi:ribosomal protein S18 acetylase RimI-like enzyme
MLVAELVPSRITVKRKLGQNRSGAQIEGVLAGLFRRGLAGDLRAIRMVRDAHPERPTPAFLRGPEGVELCVAPDGRDAEAVAALLEGTYWSGGFDGALRARAQLGSDAWVVAREATTGEVVGSARAITDGARFGYVLDVIVDPGYRRRGVGGALMRLLLDHPRVRAARALRLRTRDAHAFYARFGFRPSGSAPEELERAPSP